MAGLHLPGSKPFLQGCTLSLFFAIASSPPPAAAQVSAAADGAGTRVVVNGNEFTIIDGKLSGANQFHSFDRFDLNSSQSARFQSPAQVKNILGRITGGSPSMIDGLIRVSGANANLYLINPTGISFGPNARLDLPGSFHASTAQAIRLGEGWFRASGANKYEALGGIPNAFAFLHNNPGAIINAGHLQVPAGETITLMGGAVINTGTITAQGGTVNLLAVGGAKLVEVGASQQLLSLALPTADQQAITDGLQPLTPASLPALLTGGSISHASTIEVASDGTVRLRASGAVVPSGPGVVMASGSLDASGKGSDQAVGGRVAVLADVVSLSDATVDVSGRRGGGTALIGGDLKGQGPLPTAHRTTVDGGSTIHADAIEAGQGGKVVIWADGQTLFQGQVSAKGGQTSGDGGFVEISGKSSLHYDGNVNTSAPMGATGTLLLDPKNIRIVPGNSGGTDDAALSAKTQILAADPPDADMVISESKIEAESINNDLAFEASEGITMQKLSDGVLALTNGITFLTGGGGFTMNSADKIGISALEKHLTIESTSGIIKLGDIKTFAGNVTIKGAEVLQPATGKIATDQGNVNITSTGKIEIGSILTNNSSESEKKSISINTNVYQEYGNVNLESSNSNIIVTSIDTSTEFDSGDEKHPRRGRGRAGNVTVLAPAGVFRATGEIPEKKDISIDTSGRTSLDNISLGQVNANETFGESGIGKVTITSKSSADFFITGASATPSDDKQRADIVSNGPNRTLFQNSPQVSGSFGAAIGFSTNANLESVISDKGFSNSNLFNLNISKFPTPPPPPPPPPTENTNGGSGSVASNTGVSSSTSTTSKQGPQISSILDRQNISNTKQLDQTASTTQCAERGEKECKKELGETSSYSILDISAFKK